VKSVPGRKNLLWLSAAFPLTTGTAQRTVAPGIGYDGPLDQWRTFGMEMNRTMAALNDADVSGLIPSMPRPRVRTVTRREKPNVRMRFTRYAQKPVVVYSGEAARHSGEG